MAGIKLKFDNSTGLIVTETSPGEYTVSSQAVIGGPSTIISPSDPFTLMAGPVQPHSHRVEDVLGAGTGSGILMGTEGAIPALSEGQLYWATDTDTLFIGT
jgi:hypothetical protein